MTLNDAQQRLVESEDKLLVGLSGPGSGKTRCLVERIKRRHGSSVMAVMTYTNAAAHVLRQRLGDCQPAYLGTLHGYCYRLLQSYGDVIGYKAGSIAILPEDEKVPRLTSICQKLGYRKLTHAALKMKMDPAAVAVWKEYEFILKQNNLVDYDGILRETAELLKLLDPMRIFVTDLMVDEAHDSAAIDWRIYGLIPCENSFFIGDPDQSVYAFRGASPHLFVELCQRPEATVILLEKNYRSDNLIALAANNLIGKNKMRVPKSIDPVSEEQGDVFCRNADDEQDELEMIACRARYWQPRGASMALLVRTNHLATRYATALLAYSLPVLEPNRVVRPPDLHRALLLLSILASPSNEILIERYLRIDNPHGLVDTWILEAQAGAGPKLGERISLVGFTDPLRILAENHVGIVTINYVADRMKLLPPDASVADLVQDLYAHEEMQREPEGDGIYVGTMHSAKGREWDVVFLPAFEESIVPKFNGTECTSSEAEIEEERRLAFVAITRARHELHITHTSTRTSQWAGPQAMQPSRFIEEMRT